MAVEHLRPITRAELLQLADATQYPAITIDGRRIGPGRRAWRELGWSWAADRRAAFNALTELQQQDRDGKSSPRTVNRPKE